MLHRTRLSRRTLGGAFLIGGGAVALGLSDRDRYAAAQATPGGGQTVPEFRVGLAGEPLSMDPHERGGSNVEAPVHYMVFDTLIRRDFRAGDTLVPSLATEWERVDDRTLDVALRPGVTWHDGTPFTAADVVFTFERATSGDPKLASANQAGWALASVEALDDLRVRFVASRPDPVLERNLASGRGYIVPAAYLQRVGDEVFRRQPVGTGPYRIVEWIEDDRMAFEAHAQYFGGAPAAGTVTARFIPEVTTRVAGMLNGELDLVTDLPPDQLAALEERPGVTVETVPSGNIHDLYFNMRAKPMDRREIRQALGFAIDRELLIEALWHGYAAHPRGFQFEGEEYFNPDRPLTPYDPDRARGLLEAGGYAGEEIIYVADAPDYYINERAAAEAIAGMWREVGINVTLEFVEVAQRIQRWTPDNVRDHVHTLSATSDGFPESYLWRFWGPESVGQRFWLPESAARYNEIGQELLTTSDKAQRFGLVQQMLDEWEREAPGTLLYVPNGIYAVSDDVEWSPTPLYYLDLRPYNFRVG